MFRVSLRSIFQLLQSLQDLSCLVFVPQSPRHPGQAQEREDDLHCAFWLEAPGGHSPHPHHFAVVSYLGARTHRIRHMNS